MGFCSCTARFVLFFFNLACALLGLAILGLSTYMYIEGKSLENKMDGELTLSTIPLIVIGGAIFLIAFFGCCGAIREDPCCLNTYGVILSVLLLCQIAVGVIAFVYRGSVERGLAKYIEGEFHNATTDQQALNDVAYWQKNFQCCGLDGPDFWVNQGKPVPPSCCKGKDSCNPDDAWHEGCKDKAITIVKRSLYVIGAAAVSFGAIEILGVIFAFCLASSIKRRELRGYA